MKTKWKTAPRSLSYFLLNEIVSSCGHIRINGKRPYRPPTPKKNKLSNVKKEPDVEQHTHTHIDNIGLYEVKHARHLTTLSTWYIILELFYHAIDFTPRCTTSPLTLESMETSNFE